MSDDKKESIIRVLNAFENDSGSPDTEYDKIYIYRDGPGGTKQVTLARGYTECGGALWKVFEYYKQAGGQNGDKLLSFKKYSCKGTLPKDQNFLRLIIDSARNEESFRNAEDKVFDALYWDKGYAYFKNGGFKENLSLAVIQDSFLHSGGMLRFLTNKFAEKRPAQGGNEKKWITEYVKARLNWLSNSSQLLRNTVYRPKFFLGEIKKSNWNFDCPLVANGAKIC